MMLGVILGVISPGSLHNWFSTSCETKSLSVVAELEPRVELASVLELVLLVLLLVSVLKVSK